MIADATQGGRKLPMQMPYAIAKHKVPKAHHALDADQERRPRDTSVWQRRFSIASNELMNDNMVCPEYSMGLLMCWAPALSLL